MNVTTATPLEIDTRIAELYTAELELERRERTAMTAIHRGLGEQLQVTGRGINRREAWPTSDDDALAAMRAKGDELIGMMRPASTLVAKYTEASAALAANRAEQAPLHAEYRARGRWTRIFEVAGGHYHREQNCSTLHRGRERTTLGWRVEFAGADLDKTIADLAGAAHILCSVCIPNAPVATGPAPVRKSAAQKTADKAAAARKARTEEPKLIADVDGEPLRVDGTTLRTVRSAEIAGVDALWWAAYGRHVGEPNEPYAQKYEGYARQIAGALAHKRGTTPAAELAGMVAKALRKLRKELGTEIAAAASVVWAPRVEYAEPEGILCEPSPAAGCAYRNPCEARVVQLLDAGTPVTCTALGCVPHLAQDSGAGEDSALASAVAVAVDPSAAGPAMAGQSPAGVIVDAGQLLAAVDAYAAAAAALATVRARQGHDGAAVAGVALARAGVAALLGARA